MDHSLPASLLAALVVSGCSSQKAPANPPEPAGPADAPGYFRVLGPNKVEVAKGAKLQTVVDKQGEQLGFTIIAQDNPGPKYVECVCLSACDQVASDRCKEVRTDTTSTTTITCDGSCVNSEGNGCGGCSIRINETPPPGGRVEDVTDVHDVKPE